MVAAVQATPDTVAVMRAQPFWPQLEAAAQTLAYEADVMGPANELPAGLLTTVTAPTLVLNGGASPGWMTSAGTAVTRAISGGVQAILAGQAHNVAPSALVPALREFFAVL
jgi:hypothetical protein